MGYTRYWERTEKPMTDEFVEVVKEIVADCYDRGIMIRDGWGKGLPHVTKDIIALNGDASKGLEHESFFLDNEHIGFNFCKTARKPYDYAVRQILDEAEIHGIVAEVSSDGRNDEIVSDEDYSVKFC